MGYGALSSGTPIATRCPSSNATTSRMVTSVTAPSMTSTERSPLIRRPRRQREPEGILNWKILGLLAIFVSGLVIAIHLMVIEYNEWPTNYPFHLIDRSFWYRGESIEKFDLTPLNSSQVSHVVLFHTRGDHCFNFSTCVFVINQMHTILANFPFNFLIGGDGKTYELRGWQYVSGFDSLPFNNQSFTVAFIGDFTFAEPAEIQVGEFKALINESIRRRKLSKNYKIHGARFRDRDGLKMFKRFEALTQWSGLI